MYSIPMKFIPLELQGAYPRYGIHTSVFAVYNSNLIIYQSSTIGIILYYVVSVCAHVSSMA